MHAVRTPPGGPPAAVWWLAIRPATLPAAIVPVLVGSALAAGAGGFHPVPALVALGGALLIQIGTNLANDVADCERGADDAARIGPTRVTQSGLLSARQVRGASWLAFAGAAVLGSYLIARSGWPIAVLGGAAIASGWAYTAGPWPLGYHGLGEVFVFVFFGLAAVLGTAYVQSHALDGVALVAALPVGALASAILVVNNTRDADTDRIAGKRTLAVRLGARLSRVEYAGLLLLAYAACGALALAAAPGALLAWATLPAALRLFRRFRTAADGASFNAALRDTARLHLVFGILLAVGLIVR